MVETRVALITGVTGQDGSYLADLLLEKGYKVHGLIRRSSVQEGSNFHNLKWSRIEFHYGDVLDLGCLIDILKSCSPDEVYNLAGQSHVSLSFKLPKYSFQVNTEGCMNMLQAIIHCGMQHQVRMYQASTSEMFGGNSTSPLHEDSVFCPQSPYATSKLAAYWLVRQYRESYSLWVVNGIAFNHESPRRSRRFVTQRIAHGIALNRSTGKILTLANVNSIRDWGHAKDYVRAMWMMLQNDEPKDFVLSTGVAHSVKDFVDLGFRHVGVQLGWRTVNSLTEAYNMEDSSIVLRTDENLARPSEVHHLLGDSSKLRQVLGWQAEVSFQDLVEEMVDSEMGKAGQKDKL